MIADAPPPARGWARYESALAAEAWRAAWGDEVEDDEPSAPITKTEPLDVAAFTARELEPATQQETTQ
jgi:hypothetical protein